MAWNTRNLIVINAIYICKNKIDSIHTWWENITKATGAKSHWKSRPSQAMWQEMAWSKRNLYVISAILHFLYSHEETTSPEVSWTSLWQTPQPKANWTIHFWQHSQHCTLYPNDGTQFLHINVKRKIWNNSVHSALNNLKQLIQIRSLL